MCESLLCRVDIEETGGDLLESAQEKGVVGATEKDGIDACLDQWSEILLRGGYGFLRGFQPRFYEGDESRAGDFKNFETRLYGVERGGVGSASDSSNGCQDSDFAILRELSRCLRAR